MFLLRHITRFYSTGSQPVGGYLHGDQEMFSEGSQQQLTDKLTSANEGSHMGKICVNSMANADDMVILTLNY